MQVDPRVGLTLDKMNNAGDDVNNKELELTRSKKAAQKIQADEKKRCQVSVCFVSAHLLPLINSTLSMRCGVFTTHFVLCFRVCAGCVRQAAEQHQGDSALPSQAGALAAGRLTTECRPCVLPRVPVGRL